MNNKKFMITCIILGAVAVVGLLSSITCMLLPIYGVVCTIPVEIPLSITAAAILTLVILRFKYPS